MDTRTLVDQLISRSEFAENKSGASATVGALRDIFGNKYVLNFGDDYNDFAYRVIIQQRGYFGAVLPMVGTNSPVELEWEGDDDFYQPIKGSRCTINLMVTDDIDYDDFYTQPEKSYKVLLQWYGYDAAPPLTGPSTWNTFWSGFIVADNFKELISTKPFPISLTANDGLGTIDSYFLNPAVYRPQFGPESAYPLQIKIIADILKNLELNLDIIAVHEWLNYRSLGFVANSAAFDSFLNEAEQKSTKEILSAILLSTNSRIFQSDNKWCIIPNSCYEAKNFSTQVSTISASLGYQAPAIATTKLGYLIANESEVVEFEKFNGLGVYIAQESHDAHIGLPADVKNIHNDLIVEYLPAYKEVSINYNIESFHRRKFQVNPNQFFHYGNVGYAVNEGFIGRHEYTLGDSNYSYRSLQSVTNESFYIPVLTSTMVQTLENIFVNKRSTIKLDIDYFYDTGYQGAIGFDWSYQFRYSVKVQYGATTQYYDAENETWSGLAQYINESTTDITQFNEWISTSTEFTLPVGPTFNDVVMVEVIIYRPYVYTQGFYNAMYVGSVSLQTIDNLNFKSHNYKSTQANNTDVYNADRLSVEHITGFGVFGQEVVENGQVAERPRDNYPDWVPTNRSQVINREIMNDFRSGLPRYEGTLKNNHYKPLSMLNRVWINFGSSVLRLPDSCYIDSMQANFKRNEYKVNMHLPNIDTDQLAVETNQFKK